MKERSPFRVVFFGTPEFALPALRALLSGPDEVVAAVCQPDRPAGRGQKLQAPPVKQAAEQAGVAVLQPDKIRTAEFAGRVREMAADIGVVAAYGRILPPAILEAPRRGCINIHASLLPRYRGAAPIQWAILNGDATTGVTIMQMNEKMDEGDILRQRETPIAPQETYGELQVRLANLGAEALMEALAESAAGTLPRCPQDHARATLAPMIRKEHGEIDWSRDAAGIARAVRAYDPWPSAFTWLGKRRLKLMRAEAAGTEGGAADAPPGSVLAIGDSVDVAAGRGVVRIRDLQLEGRRAMPAADLVRGGALHPGDRLGAAPG